VRPLILVVDDDAVARFLYRQALEGEGFRVVDADDGIPALAIFQDCEPGLVLLDVLMPGMDGFATCAALRRLPKEIGAHVPVLIVTGLEDVDSIKLAYEAGATDFIGKPINWTILSHRVRYMLRANESFRQLGESERQLAQAQRIAALGSWDWDLRTGEMVWSREMFRLLGYASDSERQTPGLPAILARVHPEDRESFQCVVDQILAGHTPIKEDLDLRINDANGGMRNIRFMGRAVRDQRGQSVRIVGVAQDITERRRGEDELRHALDRAEAANRTKSEFLATMSHELRTPMNAILGFTEIMEMELFGPLSNERYQDYVRLIHKSGEHLLHLINAILDLSKAEQGMIELRDELVEIAETARACRRLLQTQADAKGITVTLDLPDQPVPPLWADELRVRQILLNLLSNALKFTPDHGTVILRIRREPDDSGHDGGLMLEVADTGIGMRAEDIPIALAKFGQIDSSHSRRYDGTGLGLPLTQRLIELHGGTLKILSTPDIGTTIVVTFPPERVFTGNQLSAPEKSTTFTD
jgi:two-component system cell cycle sensor histidine kinase PleC